LAAAYLAETGTAKSAAAAAIGTSIATDSTSRAPTQWT
jgi:hypothetical protein